MKHLRQEEIRQGESGRPPARAERFFEKDQYWYYATREGVDIGPFDTFSDAVAGCAAFIEFISEDNPGFPSTLAQYARRVA